MNMDSMLIAIGIILVILLVSGFLKFSRENPKLLGVGDYSWDKFVAKIQPKHNYSIFEDPEEDE